MTASQLIEIYTEALNVCESFMRHLNDDSQSAQHVRFVIREALSALAPKEPSWEAELTIEQLREQNIWGQERQR